jgi:hypothetical protein
MEVGGSAPRRSGRPSRFTVLPVARLLTLGLTLFLVGLELGPARAADLLWHRLLGGQRLSMGDYVREMGATTGAPAAGGG